MNLNVSYNTYQMFTDEEQLIYEDDDVEGWDDELPSRGETPDVTSSTEVKHDQINISDAFDQGYFMDRTLSSYSAPENRIWNLATCTG